VLAVTTVTQELDAASGGVFEFRLNREAEMVAVEMIRKERKDERITNAVSRLKGASKWRTRLVWFIREQRRVGLSLGDRCRVRGS